MRCQAERSLSEAVQKGAADYPDVHHALGVIYHCWGLYSKARASFERALALNPKYTEAALNLAITYNDLGRYAEAQEILAQHMPKGGPLDDLTRSKIANKHAELGDAYRSAGLPGDAAVEYRRALGLRPSFVDIRARLATALAEDGQLDDAIEQLQLVLSDNPDFVPAMLQLALLSFARGDRAAARAVLGSILARHPGHERATAYLRMLEQSTSSA